MDIPTTDFVRAGRIDRYSSSTTKVVSSRSTIAALIWAFRWIAAASRMANALELKGGPMLDA